MTVEDFLKKDANFNDLEKLLELYVIFSASENEKGKANYKVICDDKGQSLEVDSENPRKLLKRFTNMIISFYESLIKKNNREMDKLLIIFLDFTSFVLNDMKKNIEERNEKT